MSFFGTGGEDWVELDVDQVEFEGSASLRDALSDNYDEITKTVGASIEARFIDDGLALLIADGEVRYRAGLNRDGRLVLTSILHPEGPL